ncbi:MAG: hypothetical protein VYE15_02635 [Myxococcota bacterium]|nr:hypothetical protein [Myxococcota bacterium]
MGDLNRRWILVATVMVLGVWVAPSAYAQDVPEQTPQRSTTITVSLSAPWQGVGELACEPRIVGGWSTVVVAGIGEGVVAEEATDNPILYEVGGQVRYTVLGDFDDGLGFALDGRYLRAWVEAGDSEGRGFALGPRLFWKWIFVSGLTLDVHLGASWVWASLHNPRLQTPLERDGLQATGGVGLGWSFGQ